MSAERRDEGVEVSPEEERFLRRFVHRVLLPWIAAVGAVAGLALGAALAPRPLATPADAGAPIAEPGAARASAALAELRRDVGRLREELAALRPRIEAAQSADAGDARRLLERADAAARSASSLETRLRDELEPRLAKLETSLGSRRAPASREAAGDTAPASLGDLNSIRERLYNLEMRQDRKDQERSALQPDVLSRLYDLERATQTEAASRLENLRSSEQRLERLELRLYGLEQRSSVPAAPAAPQ